MTNKKIKKEKFMPSIDISKLDKAEVLVALYNAAKPQGLGFLHYKPKPMTIKEAKKLLKESIYFDYLKGRVMKINITDTLYTIAYDRDNGPDAAYEAIKHLLQEV